MTRPALLFLASLAAALSSCAQVRPRGVVAAPGTDWRLIVTTEDRKRLSDWRSAFVDGLRQARAAGHGGEIDAEGALLIPDAALVGPQLPNGKYRCRITKLGARSSGLLAFVAYPAFACRVSASQGLQQFAKLSGSQRQVGLIFPQDQLRQVFLGTLVLGDETRTMRYGNDRDRDLAGYVERIGPDRWRLLLPSPRFESRIDVVELVPIG